MKTDRLTIRLDRREKALISALARRLERNRSDTIRFVIREAARALGVETVRIDVAQEIDNDD